MEKKYLGLGVVQYPFPAKMAQELVRMFESDEDIEWGRSLIGASGVENEVRTSKQIPFEAMMPVAGGRVKEIFVNAVNSYIEEFQIDITQDEGLSLLKYDEANKYDFHVDAHWTIYRVLSGLIYLNPQDYEGGQTHFDLLDITIDPSEPCIVLFPSNYIYRHAAMPVTKGTKYILVNWMNDLPPGFSASIMANIANSVGAINSHAHNHNH
jgi:predicted 2-oxoglutarate/Fe(II)-dependent dioxygenase YbiX